MPVTEEHEMLESDEAPSSLLRELRDISAHVKLLTQQVHRIEANQVILMESIQHDARRLIEVERMVDVVYRRTSASTTLKAIKD